MIDSGEIDAMMSPRMPTCFLNGSPRVRRLFPNYKQAEMEYFKKTGLPDHARDGYSPGYLRRPSMGGTDPLQGVLRG